MSLYILSVTAPPTRAIADRYDGAALVDSYEVALQSVAPEEVEPLSRALFGTSPAWMSVLLGLRDRLMAPLGVTTTTEIRTAGATDGRDRIVFFPVWSRPANEGVVGEDDRHLDFRMSVLGQADDETGARRLVLSPAVRCHNLFGRIYLETIRPLHVLVVRANLARFRLDSL